MDNTVNKKRLVGTVVSDKMDKTVVVAVETRNEHKLYGKIVTTTQKYKAHDENNEVPLGALVRIVECRPLSKTKRWMVEEVIQGTSEAEQAVIAEAQQERQEERDDSDRISD